MSSLITNSTPESRNSAVQAIHLWIGFLCNKTAPESKFLEHHGGHSGVALWVSDFATHVAAAKYAVIDRQFDDVFEYQVTEAMGAWLSHNIYATELSFNEELNKQVNAFFHFPQTAPAPLG
jgi:hypothetical protein